MRLIVLALLTLASASSFALGVMTINTEFMCDHKAPHEGRIVTGATKPSTSQNFATTITQSNAHIVGLQEIEGCHVARDLKGYWVSAGMWLVRKGVTRTQVRTLLY